MGKSLQDQLKGLGLVGTTKEKKKETSVKVKKKPPGPGPKSPPPANTVEAREERDVLGKQVREKRKIRELEDEAAREEKLRRRAAEAEAKECIDRDRLERPEDGVSYRFNLQGTIRRIFVTQEMADQLSAGSIGIVALGETVELLPVASAQKVAELSERVMVIINDPAEQKSDSDPDDPYSEYQVPDDLVW